MRPRVLHDLSQELAVLLERGLQGARGSRPIPVLLCHPLDPMEQKDVLESGTVGILYPTRIVPETRWRPPGLECVAPSPSAAPREEPRVELSEELRMPSLWVRVRYVFLATGGPLEDQLGALAAALRTLHDHPTVSLAAAGPDDPGFPLQIVGDPDGWRDLGLAEHALTVSFEVTVPIESARVRTVGRVVERTVRVEQPALGEGGP